MYYLKDGRKIGNSVEEISEVDGINWQDQVNDGTLAFKRLANGYEIITVFTGIDQSYGTSETPLLYRTTVYNRKRLRSFWKKNIPIQSFATRSEEEALIIHEFFVRQWRLRGFLPSLIIKIIL